MSRWLPLRPAKYIDMINAIADAINERWRMASSLDLPDDFEHITRLTIPVKAVSDSGRHSNIVFDKKIAIRNAIRELFCWIIVFPEGLQNQWVQLYPVNSDNVDSVIKNILINAKFDPECFFELEKMTQYPYEDDFFDACYYLINNYLLYLSNVFSISDDYHYILKKTDRSTGETDYIETTSYRYRRIADNTDRFYKYRFYQGKIVVAQKGPLFPSNFRLKVPVKAVARRVNEADKEVSYEQIFSFVGNEADAPTLANEHIDFDSFEVVNEYITAETRYGVNMNHAMISWDSLTPPNYKYLDR